MAKCAESTSSSEQAGSLLRNPAIRHDNRPTWNFTFVVPFVGSVSRVTFCQAPYWVFLEIVLFLPNPLFILLLQRLNPSRTERGSTADCQVTFASSRVNTCLCLCLCPCMCAFLCWSVCVLVCMCVCLCLCGN